MGEQKEFLYEPLKPMLSDAVLAHHGILGQKWGKKNGPPYPLDGEDHSKSEKDAGYKKSLGGGRNEELYGRDKTERKEVKQKQKTDEYRQKMIQKYTNKGNSQAAKAYEEASDQMIADEMKHREKIRNAILITGAAVGLTAAVYIVYKRKTVRDFNTAKSFLGKKGGTVGELVKDGLDIDTAGKIMKLKMSGTNHPLSDKSIIKAIKSGVMDDMDLTIDSGMFKRIDFTKNFSLENARSPMFVSLTKKDSNVYRNPFVLQNRTGTHFSKKQISLDGINEIKIPSRKKTREIIETLLKNDPSLDDDILRAYKKMAEKNASKSPAIKMMVKNMTDADFKREIGSLKWLYGSDYPAITTMAAGDSVLNSKLSKAFKNAGYNAVADFHDITDFNKMWPGLSDLPLIMLSPSSDLKVSKVKKMLI